MANQRHVDILVRDGVRVWNLWRQENLDNLPDLSGADLTEADLSGAHLTRANLSGAKLSLANLTEAYLYMADLSGVDLRDAHLSGAYLSHAKLNGANLTRANLSGAYLSGAYFSGAYLSGANLSQAKLSWVYLREAYLRAANLSQADLSGADLTRANLSGANLTEANLSGAKLTEANLSQASLRMAKLTEANLIGANLSEADLTRADLTRASLSEATCIRTRFSGATLTGCTIYGISAWDVNLDGAKQADLRITSWKEETNITVDNLEVAQFLYLLLNNQKVRNLLDTITSKVVLILGRFSTERKPVLDALREALRSHGYVPILFDFSGPESRDTAETVTLLARMARFVIADLTDPISVPYELAKIVPDVHVPVQPLLLEGATTFSMASNLWMAREMLEVVRYTSPEELVATLPERVIAPAEAKVIEIQRERATALLRSGLS